MSASYAAARAYEEAQVGTVERGGSDGHSGNIVPYWDEIGRHDFQGQSWCGALQDDMAKHIGLHLPGSMVSTHIGAQAFKDHDQWVPVSRGAQPGDLVFFAWKGAKTIGNIDHIGFVVKPLSRTSLQTIEGNTSGSGNSGQSQRNGGMVAKRVRSTEFVVGYGRPHYAPAEPALVVSHNPYNFHDHPVYAAQWALGAKLTGKWDAQTYKLLAGFQKRHGLPQSKGVGPKTNALLAQVTQQRKV
jgi:hypothetical protein